MLPESAGFPARQTGAGPLSSGGRPPYGHRLADAGPYPNPGKAADGKRMRRLEPDPITAPIVPRIYRSYRITPTAGIVWPDLSSTF